MLAFRYVLIECVDFMPRTTNVRMSKEEEDKLNQYHGDIDSLLKFKAASSGYMDTSETVNRVLAKAYKR